MNARRESFCGSKTETSIKYFDSQDDNTLGCEIHAVTLFFSPLASMEMISITSVAVSDIRDRFQILVVLSKVRTHY